MSVEVFNFEALDSLLRSYIRGRPLPAATYEAQDLGPFLELKHATRSLSPEDRARVLAAVKVHNRSGAVQSLRIRDADAYDSFRIEAHKGALTAGFKSTTASKIVAALSELHSNVLEHSDRPESGKVAFRAGRNLFEFVVADLGIGPLASLRKYKPYSQIDGHARALSLMMEPGVSRFGSNVGRGFGYRPLFVWLANLSGHLRFRGGDHAYELDGRFGDELAVRLVQKPMLNGYFASVRCLGPD